MPNKQRFSVYEIRKWDLKRILIGIRIDIVIYKLDIVILYNE